MQSQEQLLLIKNQIIQITKELNSHYNRGDFIDADKNFNELLKKIIVIILKNKQILFK